MKRIRFSTFHATECGAEKACETKDFIFLQISERLIVPSQIVLVFFKIRKYFTKDYGTICSLFD